MTENEARIIIEGYFGDDETINEGIEIAGKALEEIQQYRALGTVEELAEIQNSYFVLSQEVRQYEKIGTVKELREAMEKQRAKKPVIKSWVPALCPSCRCELSESLGDGYYKHLTGLKVCPKCFQRLDWSGEE